LWGAGRSAAVVDLSGVSHVEIGCLEITDHSSCVEDHTGGLACGRTGPWAALGITAVDATDVHLHDLSIHGLASAGIAAARLTDWVVEDVVIRANGWVGWEGDVSGPDANRGKLLFRRVEITWNGCAEQYPDGDPAGCWSHSAGGYGDGLGTGETGGKWVFVDSTFSHNASDGLDLLYLRNPPGRVVLRRVTAAGNAGNQIKTTGPTVIEGLAADSQCGFFAGKPFTHGVEHCRAGGSAVALSLRPGDTATITEATVSGEGDCLLTAECADRSCNGTERVSVRDSMFTGGPEFGNPGDTTCLAWHDLPGDPFRFHDVVARDVKADPCPDGVTCR
jgi:hypothetical protein